jgi:hypothetical protein
MSAPRTRTDRVHLMCRSVLLEQPARRAFRRRVLCLSNVNGRGPARKFTSHLIRNAAGSIALSE